VLNKDGSFQRTARFRGPDLDSAVPAELVAVAGRLNNAFRRLGSGWAIFVEAQRHAAATYPTAPSRCRPRRWSMPSARPTSRKPARISSRLFPHLHLSAAGRGRRPRRNLAL
jgi:hypothetical protein